MVEGGWLVALGHVMRDPYPASSEALSVLTEPSCDRGTQARGLFFCKLQRRRLNRLKWVRGERCFVPLLLRL